MAIAREGYYVFSADAASGDEENITIPANTDFIIAFVFAYGGSNPSLNNPVCTLNSTAFTQLNAQPVIESNDQNAAGIEILVNPSTGSQTLSWNWGFSPYDNYEIGLIFYSGVDQSTPVVDSGLAGMHDTVTGLTAGDWIVGAVDEYSYEPTGLTTNGQTQIFAYENTGSSGWIKAADKSGAETAWYSTSGSGYWVGAGAATLNEASGGTPVSNTSTSGYEALATGAASTLTAFEALALTSTPSTAVFEALTQTTQTAQPRFEALQSVETLLATEYEALAQAIALTPIHYEALGQTAVVSLADLAIECLGRVLQSTWTNLEARQTLTVSQSALYEALSSRAKADLMALEALQQAARTHSIALESLGQAIYAATLNLEALGEALITALAEIDFEALAVAIVPGYFGVEALSSASRDALIVIEAAQTAALDLQPHFEAVQRIENATVLSAEALAELRITYQGQTESLATVLTSALEPIEALKELIHAYALPLEALGENLVLVTPHWRIYTVGREIRVISISATRD